MVAAVLQAGGLDPTVVVGGRLKHLNSGARMGQGDYLVAEADESDGSFLKLSPALSVITNIDNDHLDYYKTFDKIEDAFVTFANHVPFYGCTIVCLDDPNVKKQLSRMGRRVVTYGTDPAAQYRAQNIKVDTNGTSFEVVEGQKTLGRVHLVVPGKHNVLNALAAVIVGQELGIVFEQIAQGLGGFEGVGRRMEMKGEINGITVIDDYGHHPTEVRATISALRERYVQRRLVVVFQPHRFTRTQSLFKEFSESFKEADRVYMMDIYPAGEKPISGVTSELIIKPLKKNHPDARALPPSVTPEQFREQLASGDVVLTLGAGDVWKFGEQILKVPASRS
jgi:UDP-N-acetylmuramate--alanine ligase